MHQHYKKIETTTLLDILNDTLSENMYECIPHHWVDVITSSLQDSYVFSNKGERLLDVLEDMIELAVADDDIQDTSELSHEIIHILRGRVCKQ